MEIFLYFSLNGKKMMIRKETSICLDKEVINFFMEWLIGKNKID